MSSTKVLYAFRGHPLSPQSSAMPVDQAVRLCLNPSHPLYHLLRASSLKTFRPHSQPPARGSSLLRPHSSSKSSSSSSSSSSSLERPQTRICVRGNDGTLRKKRVVFADSKGLSLTTVRLYHPDPPSPTSPTVTELTPAKAQGSSSGPGYRLLLAFPKPSQDAKAFQARLQETQVLLESCSVAGQSLSGTVRVCNINLERIVHVHMTFDSWRSYREIPCAHLTEPYRESDTDLFAFSVALPQNLDPKESLEFCVSCRAGNGATALWDNNRGENYRMIVEPEGSWTSPTTASSLHRPTRTLPRPPMSRRNATSGLHISEMLTHLSRGQLENCAY